MPEASDPIANAIAEIEKLRGQVPDAQIEIMLAPLRAQLAESAARVAGSGAVAPGGGDALGERGVKLEGDNTGIDRPAPPSQPRAARWFMERSRPAAISSVATLSST